MNNMTKQLKPDITLTGVRPTGVLTIANYLGALKPLIDLQKAGNKPYVFVADLHAFTDYEPAKVQEYVLELVADFIALGFDPKESPIYAQSQIKGQVTTLMSYLARLISVAELLRTPTLKDKIKANQNVENANALLLLYPVLMAADILIQKATIIPVGEDQLAHLEVMRELAVRFNKRYGNVFPIPKPEARKALRLLSLKGDGKMSKSSPEGALFLTDSPKVIEDKIKRAQTAFAGEMTPSLESLVFIAKNLTTDEKELEAIDDVIKRHMDGGNVMGEFKKLTISIVNNFLTNFQTKRNALMANPKELQKILDKGGKIAIKNANETLEEVESAMINGSKD